MVDENTIVRLPADWESHARSWIVWPHKDEAAEEQIGSMKASLRMLIDTILNYEPVTIIVHPEDADEVNELYSVKTGLALDIEVFPVQLNWAKDIMPLFLKTSEGELIARSWHFNAWSKKFKSSGDSYSITNWLSGVPIKSGDPITFDCIDELHGLGSIQSDGEGTLLVTKQSMIGDKLDEGLTNDEIETLLRKELGAEKVIWLEHGIWGDNLLEGHVSGVASFASPGVVLTMLSEDESHPNATVFQENKQILSMSSDAQGRSLQVVEIPQPMTVLWDDTPLPLSYVNFYPVKGAILVPVFDDPHDTIALNAYETLFPGHDIIAINALPFFRNGGGLHSLLAPQPTV
ncbi:agmatine deiminase family protein [Marinomonas mediterranea]|jgi:Peptidylarginine deiminase and related enzymes|uniref:Agmatine deiminase n=1 Tax=Marinomonas mediterranea (strain ATCC 700492 / JCM 21426 / NBRC 103028 / MMB-1) TaxID=717774 RepID=F2JY16_MARM1|nr:agmatine deiminase family protein [Marinomonas mediterranea]ADZ90752.1 Agmatine deiminase [Marinomonas mediterranea MMB-1]WCN08793.1 hypothetical protein GV055_07535 [Marinomonas mediterranea]WCN16907.1 hypothetical protein GV053_07470 [Marinomonas mediterranea MMB-1]